MATNNPYSRTYKTKREEYEEKLKQRNENEEWIFGSSFGRPGAGAPLRDKNGNIISNLKTVSNLNLYKYDAQDFSKGDNNISVVNHKIYERNTNNGNIDHVISDPFTPFRNYINQFDPSTANNINNNKNLANINNINNLNQNQLQIIQQGQPDNLNYLNNQNNQITGGEEQKRELYLNQFKQNPYLVQTPYGFATQYPIVIPYNLNTQNQNIIQNSSNNNNNNNIVNNSNNVEYQRPYSSINQNVNNNNIIFNNQNNDNEANYITGGSSSQTAKKYIRKLPESTIFSNIDQEKIKQDKEKKLDEYKKELEKQIIENKKRKAEEKRKLKEKWKKEDLEIQKYIDLKENQKLKKEQNNKKRSNEIEASRSMGQFLESSNDADQVNKSIHSQKNDMNPNQNNDLNQNHIEVQENLNNNNYDNNIYNMNQYQYNPEEQNFKNYIDRQYHLLNDTINHDINNEMKRISEQVDKNYTPFTRKFLLMNTNSKTTAELSMENEKKLKKIQDLIEERKLVDYILGQRERPPTPQKENENQEKAELSVPSYFGINRDKPENRDLGLHSKSSFITKNDNIANFIASGRNQTEDIIKVGNNLIEKQDINNKFRDYMNDDLDEHLNYNKKLNTQKGTFGTNILNDEALGGAVNLAKNLDNISTFIPLNNNRKNINLTNEQKMKFVPGINNDFSNVRDRDMDDLFKDLDKIYELTNKIDVTSKARIISNKVEGDLNKSKSNTINEQSELLSNNNNASQNDINSVNNKNSINKDKITEEKSLNSNNKTNSINNNNNNLANSQLSSKNSNLYNNNNLNLNLNTNSNNDLYSNKDGKISSNNEKEEKELSNSQNFNVNLNNEEIKNDNINNENLENNSINNQNNIVNNEPNNNEVQDNNNQNEEEEYEEYEEEEEVEEQ